MSRSGTVKKEGNPMSVRAVLFDFDDTLGNRETYTHKTYCRRIDEKAPDLDPWMRESVIQQCLIYDQHGDTPKAYVRNRLLETMGIDLGEDFKEYWRNHQWESVVLYEDARSTLEELKRRGFLVGIITNGTKEGQYPKVEKTGILDLLDVLVISGAVGIRKPDPKIFQYAAEQLGVSCEECAFVGDMMRNDMYGAHLAGMRPIWIWPHSADRYSDLDIERIYHLSDLLTIFHSPD